MIPLLQSPALSERADLTHGFTTRAGGVSEGPLSSLNLARRPGEEDAHLVENWRRVMETLGQPSEGLVLLQQVHGDQIRCPPRGLGPLAVVGEGDALVTTTPGLTLAVRVADCVPVLMAGPGGAAAIHSGWRGTAQEIATKTLRALCERLSCSPREITVALGPSIGCCCYEVGEEVASAMERLAPEAVDRARGPRPHVSLRGVIERGLRAAGAERVERVGGCTACESSLFSHRADGPAAGRMAGVIGLR